jgi:hypothetical protein
LREQTVRNLSSQDNARLLVFIVPPTTFITNTTLTKEIQNLSAVVRKMFTISEIFRCRWGRKVCLKGGKHLFILLITFTYFAGPRTEARLKNP